MLRKYWRSIIVRRARPELRQVFAPRVVLVVAITPRDVVHGPCALKTDRRRRLDQRRTSPAADRRRGRSCRASCSVKPSALGRASAATPPGRRNACTPSNPCSAYSGGTPSAAAAQWLVVGVGHHRAPAAGPRDHGSSVARSPAGGSSATPSRRQPLGPEVRARVPRTRGSKLDQVDHPRSGATPRGDRETRTR